VRPEKREQDRVRVVPSPEAVFWRSRPLSAGSLGFLVHPYLEYLYGRIAMDNRRINSTRGLLDYVVAFANHEEHQLLPRWIRAERDDDEHALAMLPELSDEAVEKRRDEMRSILRAAVTPSGGLNLKEQPDDLLESISDRIKAGIEWTISIDRNAGFRTVGLVRSPDAFVGVILGLLLDEKHRGMLGHCRNGDCVGGGRLFMVEHTDGTPRHLYCSDDCMLTVNAKGNAARKRESYKRRRATEILIEGWRGRAPDDDTVKKAIKQAFKNNPHDTAEQLAERAKAIIKAAPRGKK
jgi:hypothetical protein